MQTQLVYDMERFREYMKRVVDMGVAEQLKIIVGVGPLKSAGMAKFMRDQNSGHDCPRCDLSIAWPARLLNIDTENKA